jgi:hypothetical protein
MIRPSILLSLSGQEAQHTGTGKNQRCSFTQTMARVYFNLHASENDAGYSRPASIDVKLQKKPHLKMSAARAADIFDAIV